MVYMRGTSTDYDGWRQKGCEGWGYDDVLPFFKKAEDQQRGPDEFHGVGGPLHVSNPVRCALGDAMVQAAIEAGIPVNDDFNGARQEGVGYYQTTTPLTPTDVPLRHDNQWQGDREVPRNRRG
jgi:choline dehydrogenase